MAINALDELAADEPLDEPAAPVEALRAANLELQRVNAALRRSEGRLRLVLCAAPLVALSQDRGLRVLWAHILGEEVELAGRTDADLFPAAEVERVVEAKRAVLASGLGQRLEVDMIIAGVPRCFDFRIERIEEHGEVVGVRSIGFDITPSKLAEVALREADARKDQFLATISHELRAPLTPLRAALEIQRLAPDDAARMARARATIERQVDHLVRLVDDMLDLSRITQDKLTFESARVEIAALFHAAVEIARPLIDHAGHTLIVSPPAAGLAVIGDATRLRQVLANLLINASKYPPPGGRIELFAQLDEAAASVTFHVRDNGVGIAPELLPRVFELFVQGEHRRRGAESGLGIGLNLVRRLVESHGGTVSAHSDGPGRGAELRVCLPLEASPRG